MITGGLKVRSFINAGLLLLSAVTLQSCSESGGGGFDVADGGISGTGISSGSISAFSSVIVNGTKLEITDTSIFIDDQTAIQSDLKVGYVIRVEADFDSDIAERIDYSATVLGPITATPVFNPDTLAGSMDVLGQTVLTNSITIFDGVDPSTLTVDDVLEVSGVRNASGAIVARYISRKTLPVDRYQVLGRVAGLNPPTSFSIGNLSVNYLGADISSEFGPAGIQEGDEVRVRALPSDFVATGPVLNAREIKRSTLSVVLSNGDSLELEGVVTDFQSLSNMTINDLKVDASDATIENGVEADIKADVLVEIEGQVSEADVLIASKVKIVPLSNIRVEATVDSVNPDTKSLIVLGQEFFVDDKTQFEDNSVDEIIQFSLSNLLQSNRVELRAYSLEGKLILTRLERDDFDPDNRTRIQGPVEAVDEDNKTVTVLGIVLNTDTNTKYENAVDVQIAESLFFSSIDTNGLVQAKWRPFNGLLSQPVDELSIEID